MLDRIAEVLSQRCGLVPGSRLVTGVSGGPDSVCLLHVLRAAGYAPVVAHFDHQLRPESGAEAQHVAALAAKLGLEFVTQAADVRRQARSAGMTLEEAARNLRYAFLFEQARKYAAHAVAVGHTADDQVETLVMHLVRGAGLAGLTGMGYRSLLPLFDASVPVVRPLLSTWRAEILDYCRMHSLPVLHDQSNDSPEFFRNRVRLELLPVLQTYNPRAREALWRTAESLAADLELVEERLVDAWRQTVLREDRGLVGFDAAELRRQPVALQRRLIMRAASRLQPAFEVGFAALERAASLLAREAPIGLDLGGGLRLYGEGSIIFLALGPESLAVGHWPQISQGSIAVPRGTPIRLELGEGWHFVAEYTAPPRSPREFAAQGAESYRACLDADSLPEALELRPPRPGDRLLPLGMRGHSQKLSDVFINGKLPARARRRWPLLCSGSTLVWVPGFRPAEPFRICGNTRTAACFAVSRAAGHSSSPSGPAGS